MRTLSIRIVGIVRLLVVFPHVDDGVVVHVFAVFVGVRTDIVEKERLEVVGHTIDVLIDVRTPVQIGV